MKVICKGYEFCYNRGNCSHSKEHEKLGDCELPLPIDVTVDKCECTVENTTKFKRKEKLKKLEKATE